MLQRFRTTDLVSKLKNDEDNRGLAAIAVEAQVMPDCYGEISATIDDVVALVPRLQQQIAATKPFSWKMALDRSVADSLAGSRELVIFFADRLKVQQREAGVRHDLIDAVFALGGEDDLVRLLARVKALQAFVETEDGRNLIAGYKRAANILRKEGFEAGEGGEIPLSYTPEKEEADLMAALSTAEGEAAYAVEAEEFEAAMSALATLRAPIDAFFEAVIVNDPDPAKREARLGLLARIRSACHQVADFSRIEG